MPDGDDPRKPSDALCPECGKPLTAGRPRGLCPACLLRRGLETNTVGFTDDAPRRWTPPAVEQLAGLFPELEILELIGRGGMGAVYKAREKQLDRLVALKILPPEIGRDEAFAQRFTREAQAMAKLSHPNIVTIHAFGQRGDLYFFLMEYVDGLSLRQVLDRGTLSADEALAIVPQICDALQYAHDQGIVHRDIKPENILLSRAGQVKIADFGLAKLVGLAGDAAARGVGAAAPEVTQAGKVMGTPDYMAPEQFEHPGDVDHRADIYSLGVVFYQMLTGELPASRDQLEPPSRKVLIDVRLDEVVLRALERRPERRYQQVSEVRTQVETIVATQAQPPDASQPSAAARRRLSISHLRDRLMGTPRRLFASLAVLVALLVPVLLLMAAGSRQGAERLPDLRFAVNGLKLEPYPAGGLFTLTAAIENVGPGRAAPFRVTVYNPAKARDLPPNRGYHTAGPIEPGKTWNEAASALALDEGANTLYVELDAANEIREILETNNVAKLEVTIADGRIVSQTFLPDWPALGSLPTGGIGSQTLPSEAIHQALTEAGARFEGLSFVPRNNGTVQVIFRTLQTRQGTGDDAWRTLNGSLNMKFVEPGPPLMWRIEGEGELSHIAFTAMKHPAGYGTMYGPGGGGMYGPAAAPGGGTGMYGPGGGTGMYGGGGGGTGMYGPGGGTGMYGPAAAPGGGTGMYGPGGGTGMYGGGGGGTGMYGPGMYGGGAGMYGPAAPATAPAETGWQREAVQVAARFIQALMADDRPTVERLVAPMPGPGGSLAQSLESIWAEAPAIRELYKDHAALLDHAVGILGNGTLATVVYRHPHPTDPGLALLVGLYRPSTGQAWKVLDVTVRTWAPPAPDDRRRSGMHGPPAPAATQNAPRVTGLDASTVAMVAARIDAIMPGVVAAIESGDAPTADRLVQAVLAMIDKHAAAAAGTPLEQVATTARGMFQSLHEALQAGDLARAEAIIRTIDSLDLDKRATDAAARAPRPDPAKARALVESGRALMGGVYRAMEQNDPDTALTLLREEIAQGRELLEAVRGTPAEGPVRAALPMLERIEAALAAGDVAKARQMLETLDGMGPGLDDAIKEGLKAPAPPAAPPDRAMEWRRAATDRAQSFLATLRQGPPADLYADTTPHYRQSHAGRLEHIAAQVGLSSARPTEVHFDSGAAFVVVSPVVIGMGIGSRGRPVAMGLGMIRVGDTYLIGDIESLPDDQAVRQFVDGFLDARRDSQPPVSGGTIAYLDRELAAMNVDMPAIVDGIRAAMDANDPDKALTLLRQATVQVRQLAEVHKGTPRETVLKTLALPAMELIEAALVARDDNQARGLLGTLTAGGSVYTPRQGLGAPVSAPTR